MEYSKKTLPGMEEVAEPAAAYNTKTKTSGSKKKKGYEPLNLGKAIKLQVPDFSDPNRPKTCLEVDFPIGPINPLARLDVMSGAARKPIYQMGKWWARRSPSVFRTIMIAAATTAPDEVTNASKHIWQHYYANHKNASSFTNLKVLDPFMGGGTTLVEGTRLGFQVTGIDLNPVAWFITKNELNEVSPENVKELLDDIESQVRSLVQPFFIATCPRGHSGHWIDKKTGEPVDINPFGLQPNDRKKYHWNGPEIIYTFWTKHGTCSAPSCGHRTPILKDVLIAVKSLSAYVIPLKCSSCEHEFQVELGETRMAPDAERVVLDSEPSFTETSQVFAQLMNDYNKGRGNEKQERIRQLLEIVDDERGFCCPACGAFAGEKVKRELTKQSKANRTSDINKNKFGIKRYRVNLHLLIHPDWLSGDPSKDEHGNELGGYAGSTPQATATWYALRQKKLRHIEVRGESLPEIIHLEDGRLIKLSLSGTMPKNAHFVCSACGRQHQNMEATESTGQTSPISVYAMQCYCPQCDTDGFNYGGRYYSSVSELTLNQLISVEFEWDERKDTDLSGFWPTGEIAFGHMTHQRQPLPQHGYTHWWKMFNTRQLLLLAQLLKAITFADPEKWSLEEREQALGTFLGFLRYDNLFSFHQSLTDNVIPLFSNANYYPKYQPTEIHISPYDIGQGNWKACTRMTLAGLNWAKEPWERTFTNEKSITVNPGDSLYPFNGSIYCRSSTDLSILDPQLFDLVITDPPFGNLLYYADLADFFYAWLQIPLQKWYEDKSEGVYFSSPRTPHAMEAIENPAEHPDDREKWERTPLISQENIEITRKIVEDRSLKAADPNPLYRQEPASEFYRQTLTACWAEANHHLKPGGMLIFTFHHSEDEPWIDVLESLFNAGYILVATYPIRSDESKGDAGEFGSKKIEYDIIHVCRKRLNTPEPVSWSQMRRWVKKEAQRLKEMLEISHGQDLLEPDMLVILRGKALEFYSRHYGQVYTGDDDLLGVRDALLGINQLLEDVIAGEAENGHRRPPDAAEPATRFYLRLFQKDAEMDRDELHKTMRGTGITSDDFEARGWITVAGTTVKAIPIEERFAYFTSPGRNRKVLKTDLDQAHFLIGAALPGSGLDITQELNRNTFALKKSVDVILEWYAQIAIKENIQKAAQLASGLVTHWRAQPQAQPGPQQMSLFQRLEAEE